MNDETFHLIGSTRNFDTTSKVHIAKSHNTMFSKCGKTLGFDYTIISVSGFQDDYPDRFFKKNEIKELVNVCKSCLKTLKYE